MASHRESWPGDISNRPNKDCSCHVVGSCVSCTHAVNYLSAKFQQTFSKVSARMHPCGICWYGQADGIVDQALLIRDRFSKSSIPVHILVFRTSLFTCKFRDAARTLNKLASSAVEPVLCQLRPGFWARGGFLQVMPPAFQRMSVKCKEGAGRLAVVGPAPRHSARRRGRKPCPARKLGDLRWL